MKEKGKIQASVTVAIAARVRIREASNSLLIPSAIEHPAK